MRFNLIARKIELKSENEWKKNISLCLVTPDTERQKKGCPVIKTIYFTKLYVYDQKKII